VPQKPFQYACFISYCHGQADFTRRFIEELADALKAYLDPYLDEQVYIDQDRLQPGYKFNEALAEAICRSVCMVVVYSPRYEDHAYCMREYAAMEKIEQARFALLGQQLDRTKGMIVPVVLRGEEDLPSKLKSHIHYADFSKYTLADQSIKTNPAYIAKVEAIAKHIYKLYRDFKNVAQDPCADCAQFEIPLESQLISWRAEGTPAESPFPLRQEGL
jgi:hypothetical protein